MNTQHIYSTKENNNPLENIQIALLFGMFSSNNYKNILSNSKGVIQNAANILQTAFVDGLGEHCPNINIINLPYIGSWPSRNKQCYFQGGDFQYRTETNKRIQGKDISFSNIIGFKMYSRYSQAKKALCTWCKKYPNKQKVVIVYALHIPFMKACVDVKHKNCKDLKIVQIVPDLPEYMSDNHSWLYDIIEKYKKIVTHKLCKEIDGFVLLSKYMAESLPINKKTWVVIEGIYNEKALTNNNIRKKQILYTGTLAKRYGIMNLVKAFSQIKNTEYELIICGAGDAEREIKQWAENNNRIIFKGQISHEEITSMQRKVTLLVNPRTPEGDYTKYSFPSKTMEYMASGTPCLLYRLPGIPSEYFEHCFVVEELGIIALAEKIQEILALPTNILETMGKEAQQFILQQKNTVAQTSRLIELINQL